MTPWRTYADPVVLDPVQSAKERRDAGRALRDERPFAVALAQAESMSVTGIVVPLVAATPDSFGPVDTGFGAAVLDVLDVDDALPGPWEWDLLLLARGVKGAPAVRALAEGYQAGVAAIAGRPLHAARDEAADIGGRLARGLRGENASGAEALLVASGPRLRPGRVAERWGVPVSAPLGDVTRELAQYRESVSEPVAALLAHYRVADALAAEDGRLIALLAHGSAPHRDVILLEATAVGPSPLEPLVGAWREGSDIQRVLLARESLPLVPQAMQGWSTSPDGSVARVWARARALPGRAPDLGGRRKRAASMGTVLGLIHAAGGDANALHGYLGRSRRFGDALVDAVA